MSWTAAGYVCPSSNRTRGDKTQVVPSATTALAQAALTLDPIFLVSAAGIVPEDVVWVASRKNKVVRGNIARNKTTTMEPTDRSTRLRCQSFHLWSQREAVRAVVRTLLGWLIRLITPRGCNIMAEGRRENQLNYGTYAHFHPQITQTELAKS